MGLVETSRILLTSALFATPKSIESTVDTLVLEPPGRNALVRNIGNISDPVFSEPILGFLESFSWNNSPIPASGLCQSGLEVVDKEVMAEMKRSGIPGCSVSLIVEGKVIYCRGFGYSDLSTKERFTPYTTVKGASTSKSFVACAALKLVEQGKLSRNDSMLSILQRNDYEIGKSPKDPRIANITIQDLLDHTSGFSKNAHFTADGRVALWAGNKGRSSASDIVNYAFATEKLNSNPGSTHQYSNLNYIILGEVLRCITDKSVNDSVRSLVFAPMGIPEDQAYVSKTISSPTDSNRRPNEAHHYAKIKEVYGSYVVPRSQATEAYGGLDLDAIGASSGFAISGQGLSKFIAALQGNFFSKQTWDTILTAPRYAQTNSNTFPNYQHFYNDGFTVHLYRGVPQLEHGGLLGFSGAYFGPVDSNDQNLAGVTVAILVSSNDIKGPFYEMRLKKAVENGLSFR